MGVFTNSRQNSGPSIKVRASVDRIILAVVSMLPSFWANALILLASGFHAKRNDYERWQVDGKSRKIYITVSNTVLCYVVIQDKL